MHGRNQKTDRQWERTKVHGAPAAAVFVLALAVRLFYLYQSSAGPAFLDPLVDALTHHELAILVANGAGLEAITASYRSYFHPAFLSAIYSVTGPSVLTAKLIQALVGAGTCTITFALGAKLCRPEAEVQGAKQWRARGARPGLSSSSWAEARQAGNADPCQAGKPCRGER